MARRVEKEKAIKMRLAGASYSQIKEKLGISKGTLSGWLNNYPLSQKRIRELRDFSPKRIENYRNTMRRKKEIEFAKYFKKAEQNIGKLSKRDLFIAGLFLYWGEGAKTTRYSISLSNTDPAMLIFFIKWLGLLNIPKSKLKVALHLYKDMDNKKSITYWSKMLGLDKSQFGKSYVKKSNLTDLTYKVGFGHGTCNVRYHNKDIAYTIHQGLKYITSLYS